MQGTVATVENNPFASYRDRLTSRLVRDYIAPVLPVTDDGGIHGLSTQLRFEDLVDRLSDCRQETIIVSGIAGTGKTSLITHLAVALLSREVACLRLPVEHLESIERGTSLREVLLRLNPGVNNDLWKSRVKKGRCVLLIDALNEVEQRHGLDWQWRFIRSLLDGPDRITILATTRNEPEGLGDSDLRNVHRLRLEGFTESEQAQYLIARGLEYEPALHQIAAAGLDGSAANPLLLSLVCGLLIERPDQRLPRSRAGVFESTLDIATKRLSPVARGQAEVGLNLPAVFSAASYCAQLDPARLFRYADVVHLCRRVWTEPNAAPDTLLSALLETHLIERLPNIRGPASYKFLHDSVMDFGLALALAGASQPPDYLFTESVSSQTLGDWVGLRPNADDAARVVIALAMRHQRYELLVDTAIANSGILSDESTSALWTAAGEAFTKGRNVRDRMAETVAKLPAMIRRQAIAGGLLRQTGIKQPEFAKRLRELIMDRSLSTLALQRLWREVNRDLKVRKPGPRKIRSGVATDPRLAAGAAQRLLDGPTVQARRSAALTLGDIGRLEDIPVLIRVLENDPEPTVRGAVATALGRTGDRRAVVALSAALAEPSAVESIRGSAANALGLIGDRQAVAALSAALAESSAAESIRGSAANALGQIGDRQAVTALSAALADPNAAKSIRGSAANALGLIGDRQAVTALSSALADSTVDHITRGSAAKALGQIGDRQAVTALSAALADPTVDHITRGSAAKALGQIGDRRAVTALSVALADTNTAESVRGSAANALGQIGDRQAVDALSAVLAEPNAAENIRGSAANALGLIGDRQAIYALSTVLADPNAAENIRGSAANALGLIGHRQAVDALSTVLADPNAAENIRGSAANALGLIGHRQAVDALSTVLADPNAAENIRGSAANALGQIGDRQAVAALSTALADPNAAESIRGSAAKALGQIGDRRAVNPLSAVLADPTVDYITRGSAANALGQIGDRQAVAALSAALADSNAEESIRGSAAKALGQIGDREAVAALSAVLADRTVDDIFRGSAAKALGQIGDPKAAAALRAIAEDRTLDSWLRNSAFSAALRLAGAVDAWALKVANPSAPAPIRGRLITALRHGDTSVPVTDWLRSTARRDPDKRNRTEAIPALERHGPLDDDTIRFLIDPAYPRPDGRRWDTENGVRGQVASTVIIRLLEGETVSRPALEAVIRMLDDRSNWTSVVYTALAPLFVAVPQAAAQALATLTALLPAGPTNHHLSSRLKLLEDAISVRSKAHQALERIKIHPEDVIMSFRPKFIMDTDSLGPDGVPTVLIVAAVSQETEAIRTELKETLHIEPDSAVVGHRIVQRFTLPAREGKVWAAVLAQPDDKGPDAMQGLLNDLLPLVKPALVLMVGMCGGLNERNVNEAEVIVARNVFGYGGQRHREDGIQVMTKPYPVDTRIIRAANQLRSLGLPKDVRWSVKDFASANILLDDLTSPLRTAIMKISDDILGFEMEGTGFLHPGREWPAAVSVPAGIIKGVSDFGDGQQRANKAERQETATRHAARVAFALLHETPQSLFMANATG